MDRRSFLKFLGLGGAAASVLDAGEALAAADGGQGPRYAMVVDLRRCVGCQSCTVSCGLENRTPAGDFRTTVGEYAIRDTGSQRTAIASLPRLCNHCEQPACIPVCPVRATYQRPDGIVVVDGGKCLGCGFCVQACPYGARFLNHETKTADKCTFCAHRIVVGLLPACVENCVGGARRFGDLKNPESLVARMLREYDGALAVLYPEKKTRPAVYYLGLDHYFTRAADVAAPMPYRDLREGGAHA
jgi:tetrathionate reductase subunit B